MNADLTAERSQRESSPPIEAAESLETVAQPASKGKKKSTDKDKDAGSSTKRRCVSTACIACRKRKSKCDGNLPKCAACASVYLTECEYAPHTDHRRKGVYKKDVDATKTKNSTLQILIQAILNAEEEDVMDVVHQIRTCDSLEELAATIEAQEKGLLGGPGDSPVLTGESNVPQFEAELSGRMGDLMLDGSVKFIGGTSNLIWMSEEYEHRGAQGVPTHQQVVVRPREEAILSWTTVTQDKEVILHFMNMYFCWHYAFFTTLAKELFYRDFLTGTSSHYCSHLLVNVMLALGCHFSSRPTARADPDDSGTTGDHFFKEAKRLLYENDEFANAKLCTVQALALMSVREAGCGHESKGWVYSGMSFRMACDLGLNVDAVPMNEISRLNDEDIDARRITFWGCFLFDKCWSNYLGRQPQLQMPSITVKRPDVFPSEESEMWSPYTDSGIIQAHAQPARTRAVALQLSRLAEISSDLLTSFYNPQLLDKPLPRQTELKRLSDLHTRLEGWKQGLPAEMEPKEGQLPQVLLMHMFFQLLYIHLYRPFLKYTRTTSPLPAHVSPRKFCTQGAAAISKLFRLYKRTHGLRQICNIAIYIVHSACTIHLLNLPDKNARRDIIHGVKHLEEMGECWTAARRTLRVLRLCAERWSIEMPEEAEMVYTRIRVKWGLSPGAPSPVSPESLANMAQQISSQPVPDLMARNVQQQQQQSQVLRYTSVSQFHTGLTALMAPSPAETVDSRRTSSGMSLPPVSAAELSRDAQRIRASTYLTKAQQDAWNAHQARLAATSAANSSNRVAGSGEQNAARMFGGVDSLIEETQDWIFRDQNQFAMGFGNWGSDPPDWGTLDLSFFDTPDGTGSSTNDHTNGNSPSFTSGMQYSYDPTATGPTSGVVGANGGGGGGAGSYAGGFPNTAYSSAPPTTTTGKIEMNAMNNNGTNSLMNPGMGGGSLYGNGQMAATMGRNMNIGREGGGIKRRSQNFGFDDVYY
ncbi:hypothetical protein G647_08026 [Cladophialophora carrionii CBS 160.54]|uniref:Zn(2)-C6 fungal-type domain-containing protein n=1 Tax=Cladophialophora carrionii CBS 160.54 TaxID=1279043 RepID=V9D443_9EURO|nr:uncharacterized protein G647_08026 [Cladophialophora carrionii CBS 160.54]ETI21679.1 hypothetical protein G647_08026 [Cladophialophora carrionii CBS 160.54]